MRPSQHAPYKYTISIIKDHTRMFNIGIELNSNGTLKCGGIDNANAIPFLSINDIINYYSKTPLILQDGEQLCEVLLKDGLGQK